jgi:isochorismate hydrolase
MKEIYFTSETINIKAFQMLEKIESILKKTKEQNFTPQKSALLIIDMQKYFCDESSIPFVPSVPAIIPKIKQLINAYRAKNLPVIFTRQVNTPEDAGMMAKWWKHTISPESDLSKITPEFNIENSQLFDKAQYDAFYNTGLESFLKEKKISQLVITGLLTHLCCETTARSAFMRGFETFSCVDGTVTYKEIYHLSSLINLAHGVSTLTMCDEICKKLDSYES